jgi:hypothetical protein
LPGVTDPAEQSLLIVSIARGFLVADRRREAIDATEEAVALLALVPGESSRVETLIAVSGLYPQLARAVSLTSAINELEDPYARALVLLAVAEALIAEGQPGVADDFLVSALDDADSSEFLSDDLKIRIVEGFARTQSYGLAVSAIERISSRSARARAAAYLGRYADPRGGLTEDQRDVLGDALRL